MEIKYLMRLQLINKAGNQALYTAEQKPEEKLLCAIHHYFMKAKAEMPPPLGQGRPA